MKRGIIFSGDMVLTILSGRKTQTRRVMRKQPACDIPGAYFDAYNGGPQWNWWLPDNRMCNGCDIINCPYGTSGDLLYVRETWQASPRAELMFGNWYEDVPKSFRVPDTFIHTYYRADGLQCVVLPDMPTDGEVALSANHSKDYELPPRWRSPIRMPRWVSRITLTVTDVRVERLQDISEDDAIAEGCHQQFGRVNAPFDPVEYDGVTAAEDFAALWDSINGDKPGRAWKDDPFVWAVTFDPFIHSDPSTPL